MSPFKQRICCQSSFCGKISKTLFRQVVAILNLLEVQHRLEYPQMPFQLDVMITPEQLKAASLEIDANEASEARE